MARPSTSSQQKKKKNRINNPAPALSPPSSLKSTLALDALTTFQFSSKNASKNQHKLRYSSWVYYAASSSPFSLYIIYCTARCKLIDCSSCERLVPAWHWPATLKVFDAASGAAVAVSFPLLSKYFSADKEASVRMGMGQWDMYTCVCVSRTAHKELCPRSA